MSAPRQVPLSDIAHPVARTVTVAPGHAYRTIGVKWWGEGAYERATIDGSQTAAKTLTLVKENDLIINKIWVRHGSTAIATHIVDGCAASGEFPTFELDRSRVEPRWIHWMTKTQHFWSKCDGLSQGTSGKNRIKPELFLTIEIPLPPLAEQRRIVARIEELAVRIAEARGLRRQAVTESKLLMPSMTDRVLTQSGADETTVEAVARSVTDGDHLPPPRTETGIPFLFISDVVGGKVDLSTCKWVSPDYYRNLSPSRIAKRNDVLYTAVGSYGVPCLVDIDEPFCFQRHIAIIKPDQQKILPAYLTRSLSSSRVFEQATAGATGSAQLTVPLKTIRTLRFPLPSLPEQRRIMAYLDGVQARMDEVKRLQAETAAELDALLPSVLDRAFRGAL